MKFSWLYKNPDSIRAIIMEIENYPYACLVYRDDGYFHEQSQYGDDYIILEEHYLRNEASRDYSYQEMLEGLKKFLVKEML